MTKSKKGKTDVIYQFNLFDKKNIDVKEIGKEVKKFPINLLKTKRPQM